MSSTTSFDLGLQQQNSFALHQLRSSQANLQQALRVQEDISRQVSFYQEKYLNFINIYLLNLPVSCTFQVLMPISFLCSHLLT